VSAAGTPERQRVRCGGGGGPGARGRGARPRVGVGAKQPGRTPVERGKTPPRPDPARRPRLITDLGVFELGVDGAALVARHAWADPETISDRTGFVHAAADPLPVTPPPDAEYVRAIRTIDADGLRERLVG